MYKIFIFLLLGIVGNTGSTFAQATLPDFTLKNTNGKISVFWLNQYPMPVNGISIQRSYDSAKNFTSIASILNPQNTVNGYTDTTPPYNKMYYRLFIGFDTGVYLLTAAKKPEVNTVVDYTALILEINELYEKNLQLQEEKLRAKKAAALALAAKNASAKTRAPVKSKPAIPVVDQEVVDNFIGYPSKRIYTDKNYDVVVQLHDIKKSNFLIKFYTDDYRLLFEVKNLRDEFVTIEKVNFMHAGWYKFEIFRNGLLYEENKFFIASEDKK